MTFSDQVQHAVELKNALVDYVDSPRFVPILQARIAAVRPYVASNDDAWTQAAEELLFTVGAAGTRTLVQRFLDVATGLTVDDEDLLTAWRDDNVYGLFLVTARDNELLQLDNLIDGMTYEAFVPEGADATRTSPRGSYLQARLLPVGPAWITSGSLTVFPARDRLKVGSMVARLLAFDPTAAFRNPANLARAVDLADSQHAIFRSLFGSDVVTGTGIALQEQFHTYLAACDSAEESAAVAGIPGKAHTAFTATATVGEFPIELLDSDDVAIISHPLRGITFATDYRVLDTAHGGSGSAGGSAVLNRYLDDPAMPASVLRGLAAKHPTGVDALYRTALDRPGFTWADDGEALLQERKPDSFVDVDLPAIALLPPIALESVGAVRPASTSR